MYVEGIASGGGSDWFYIAVIHAPNGADVHVDDGDEDIDATVASGDYIGIPVHNQNSTYTITVTMNGLAAPDQTFTTGSTSGQMIEKTFEFAEIDITYDDEFRGQTLTITDGTHTPSPAQVVPSTGNNLVLRVPYTGNWHISAVDPVSGDTFYTSPDPIAITSLSQTVSCHLFVIPDGKTVTPTDDIQTWLACANIKGKTYTTLAEVLADEDTLRKLLTDDNAIDYLKRSTTWINTDLVPIITSSSDTKPSADSFYSNVNTYGAWRAFDGDDSTFWNSLTSGDNTHWIQYHFTNPTIVRGMFIKNDQNALRYKSIELVGSIDGSVWSDPLVTDSFTNATTGSHKYSFDNEIAYSYYKLNIIGWTNETGAETIQFYSGGIDDSQLAMSYIGAYDYAADTLLGDSTWLNALVDSPYASILLNTEVPIYSAADDKIIYGAQNSGAAWYAFAGNTGSYSNNGWLPGVADNTKWWVGYNFEKPINLIKYGTWSNMGSQYPTSANIEGSNDGENWTNIETFTNHSQEKAFRYNNKYSPTAYKYFRIKWNTVGDYAGGNGVKYQFVGKADGGVQTWLKAAGLDRPYTTLSEVLADHNALAALMSSHDAVDYLVTVKSWIDAITADETAMRYIGRRNYAADTLLADSDWGQGIAASTYAQYVLNEWNIVPALSSNADQGYKLYRSSVYGVNYEAFKAFNNDATGWVPTQGVAIDTWLDVEFPSAIKLNGIKISFKDGSSSSHYVQNDDLIIQGSNDSTNGSDGTWTTLSTIIEAPWDTYYDAERIFTFANNATYKHYRLFMAGVTSVSNGFKLQYYGREDVDETAIDIFSAASDTVYYLDSSSNPVTVATTDTSGKATIQKSLLPNGTYTLYSTVAEDPDNLSNPYSKQVTITDETMDVMVMPDGSVYWYGYGDYLRSSGTGTVTKNTNYLRNTTGVSQSLSVYFDTSAKIYSKASIVFDGYSNWNYNWNGDTVAYTTGKRKATANRIDESVFGGMQNGTNTNVYAVYCDD